MSNNKVTIEIEAEVLADLVQFLKVNEYWIKTHSQITRDSTDLGDLKLVFKALMDRDPKV